MPMKIPKGFARRKSSSNALEEVKGAQPSFRVLERAPSGGKSFDGGKKLNGGRPLPSPQQRYGLQSSDDDRTTSNRGSGGSNTNSSVHGIYTDNASSTRLSSASTAPSSTDAPIGEDPQTQRKAPVSHGHGHGHGHGHSHPIPAIPDTQPAFSLRAGGRTFSFGSKAPRISVPTPSRQTTEEPIHVQQSLPRVASTGDSAAMRGRALTESSYASTATPPQLDTGFDVDFGGGFATMFDNFGKRKSVLGLEGQTPSSIDTRGRGILSTDITSSPTSYHPPRSTTSPISAIQVDRDVQMDSPHSWGSNDSKENLMSSTTPPPNQLRSDLKATNDGRRSKGLRKVMRPRAGDPSVTMDDEDAKLVMDSLNLSRALDGGAEPYRRRDEPQTGGGANQGVRTRQAPPAGLFDAPDMEQVDLVASRSIAHKKSITRKALPSRALDRPTELLATPLARSMPADNAPTSVTNKVMTPVQFERYRRQQELLQSRSEATPSKGEEEDSDNYEDEDETERNRQVAKQRRKQEAHLSVYRQQMMKMTGETAEQVPNLGRPSLGSDLRFSHSSPNLLRGGFSPTSPGPNIRASASGRTSDEDDDEDIPLGILAAHGFPRRTRPPTRLSTMPGAGGASYAPPAGSISGSASVVGGSRPKHLPPFARHLPQDPYGLVNPSNRESLAFGHARPASAYGAPMPSGLPPGLPPGGLVGVIAVEERARAMRRGSPSAQGGYGAPPLARLGGPGAMGMGGGMVMPSAAEQAQAQATAQMQQMMAMQMEWMQQMMAMQGYPTGQMPMPMPMQMPMLMPPMGASGAQSTHLMPPPMNGALGARPPGMATSQSAPNSPGAQQMHQQTMSMLDPNASQWKLAPGRQSMYAPSMMASPAAPSIAPSERSTVGMPTRYRPVSMLPAFPTDRSRTSTSTVQQGWNSSSNSSSPTVKLVAANSRKSSPGLPSGLRKSSNMVPTVSRKVNNEKDDEDDEAGWEEMKKGREKKRSIWRSKRPGGESGVVGLKDLLFPSTS